MIIHDWFAQTGAGRSAPVSTGWRVAILVCVAYQSFMVARLLFAGQPGEGAAYSITRSVAGGLLVTALAVGAAAALTACPRWPAPTCGLLAALFIAAASHGMHNYAAFPFLFSIYWIASRGTLRTATLTALGCLATTALASRLAAPHTAIAELLGQWSTLAATLVVAMLARAMTGWRRATAQATAEHEQLADVTRERDEARARTRIAGELHDSVGHDLTAIIALSEGLAGLTGAPDIDEAMAGINTLARQGLADTRRAVTALADPLNDPEPILHGWDHIEPLTQPIRSLGTPVTVTETGPRPASPAAADLAFTIAREALTNAVRHSPGGLSHLGIALDHRPGETALTIRSQGHGSHTTVAQGTGNGIPRLRRMVADAGGHFTAGPDLGGWLVDATIPDNPRHP